MSDTAKWLREIGAVRPMATAADHVLVLGEWHAGYYPIQWRSFVDTTTRDLSGAPFFKGTMERWTLFGIHVPDGLTRDDCLRILDHLKARTK